MPVPFYHNLPFWIVSFVESKTCNKCDAKITKNDIIAIGIRKSTSDKTTPYVEFSCSACKTRLITSFDGFKNASMEDICYSIIQDLKHKNNLVNSKKYRPENYKDKGPITDREVKKFVKSLNKMNHSDFLKHLKVNSNPGKNNESK